MDGVFCPNPGGAFYAMAKLSIDDADPDIEHEPFSMGRQMVCHFATPNVDKNGTWVDLVNTKNISADIAPTAGQMPRALGLAFASKVFRENPSLTQQFPQLSNNGDEVCFCTIGDASTSEGHFWEAINAAGVMQVPLAVFIWDDGYGISVPKKYQTTKGSISAALKGFQKKEDTNGIDIYRVKGWDYAGMCEVFEQGLLKVRETHVPAVFHVEELTQPQGHSTSGSHERYKTQDRLQWEREWDSIKKMKEWLIENGIATETELDEITEQAKEHTKQSRDNAWNNYLSPIKSEAQKAIELLKEVEVNEPQVQSEIHQTVTELQNIKEPLYRDIMHLLSVVAETKLNNSSLEKIKNYTNNLKKKTHKLYNSNLYNEGEGSALKVEVLKPMIPFDAPLVNGYEVLNKYFDQLFANNIRVVAFGEDVGQIGDVNQGLSGLQEKYGINRIFDTGIREQTIAGQGIGLALRGLRPFAEIQYLDYLLYALQTLSDDVSTLHYRTGGKQSCPVIIRTRGHRLEGIWHSGSPMGVIINALRGMYVCVPRNMVQAVGFYNTLLKANDPAIVIECLNGYRLKEKLPSNLLEYTIPLGVPEVLKDGTDVTIVSYGSVLRIIQDAAIRLDDMKISCEIIDVQTLLPFDIHHSILKSLQKTNRIIFVDEDVPGGAAAYMFNKVMEEQTGYKWLDVAPRTITGKEHRPSYGSDGDYFSKPNAEDIIEVILEMMRE